MTEHIRELLYPLGFLAQLAFFGRIAIQWLSSEINKKSIVTQNFWRLSLLGNICLAIHSLIQVQYHVLLVQTCNAVISWRNLNLMRNKREHTRFAKVVLILCLALVISTTLFITQKTAHETWFRLPITPWAQQTDPVSLFWHVAGFIGIILFSARFWIQWWCAETKLTSYLPQSFWWCSLVGTFLSLTYFIQIKDPVNLIGPAFGLIPYIRNLMLMHKQRKTVNL